MTARSPQRRGADRLWNAVVIGLAVLTYVSPCAAQTLDTVRHEVWEKDPVQPLPPPPPATNRDSSCEQNGSDFDFSADDDSWGAEVLWLYAAGLTSPYWAPHAVLRDDWTVPAPLLPYPFADRVHGYTVRDPDSPVGANWSVQASIEYASDFDNLDRISGDVLFSTIQRFDLEVQWSQWREDTAGGTDSLFLGRTNVLFRFAQNEYVQFRSGLGLNWITDRRFEAGVNFHYGMQAFPIKHVTMTGDIDWGTLGHAPVFHGRITAGVVKRRLEVYTGYDFENIGEARFSGPVAGLKVYF